MRDAILFAATALCLCAAPLVVGDAAGADAPDVRVDRSFGAQGRANVPASAPSRLVRQVVSGAGGALVATGPNWLLHLTPDGAGDAQFGTNGLVGFQGDGSGTFDSAGRYVFTGVTMAVPNDYDASVSRVGIDGAHDATFGTNGTFRLTSPPDATSELPAGVRALPDDSVLFLSVDGQATGPYYAARLTRITAAGAVDATYGTGGSVAVASLVAVDAGARAGPFLVGPQGDAFVVVVDPWPGNVTPVVLRHFTATGARDAAFGTGGETILPFGWRVSEGIALAFDGEGRILAAGVEPSQSHVADSLRIARILADGSADAAFGANGFVRVDAGVSGYLTCTAVVAGGADRSLCLVAGGAWGTGGPGQSFVAAVRADSPSSQTLFVPSALLAGDVVDVTGLAAQPDGRVVASAVEWAAGGGSPRSAFVLRLRFDGQDGAPPVVDPPPPVGPRVVATWTSVLRATTRRGAPIDRIDALLHFVNLGDAPAGLDSLRVFLSRDGVPDGRDRRLKTLSLTALGAGATQDFNLRLHVLRRAKGRRLIVVAASDLSKPLVVSDPLP